MIMRGRFNLSNRQGERVSAKEIVKQASDVFGQLESLSEEERIRAINEIRLSLREYSPFSSEPVDCVQWLPVESVVANDYNPNSVAPQK